MLTTFVKWVRHDSSQKLLPIVSSTPSQSFNSPTTNQTGTDEARPPTRVLVRSGDTFAGLFAAAGGHASTAAHIKHDIAHADVLTKLYPGQYLLFEYGNETTSEPQRITLLSSPLAHLQIEQQEGNGTWQSHWQYFQADPVVAYRSLVVHDSISSTTQRYGLSYPLRAQITHVLSQRMDLRNEVRNGDILSLMYQQQFIQGEDAHADQLLGISYHHGGHTLLLTQFDQKGYHGFFDQDGNSLTLGYDRYPLHFTHVSSPFNLNRFHPILHQYRPHKGMDLAASLGTPIHAVADGRVTFLGENGGYGNMVRLHHPQGIDTVYAHMRRFKWHLHRGQHVKRGEIIGYVGQTGLATAPHCHFEFRIHGKPVNPALVKLPYAQRIANADKHSFALYRHYALTKLRNFETITQTAANALLPASDTHNRDES